MADGAENYNALVSWSAERHQSGDVAAGLDEAEQPGGADGGGGPVVERVTIEAVGLHHLGVEDDGDAPGGVVDQRKGGDRSRLDAQDLAQEIGAGKGQASRAD